MGGVLTGTEVTVDGQPMCKMCYKETSPGIILNVVPQESSKFKGMKSRGHFNQVTVKYRLGIDDVVAPMLSQTGFSVGDTVTVTVGDDGYPKDITKNSGGQKVCMSLYQGPGKKTCVVGGPKWTKTEPTSSWCTYCPENPDKQCTFAPSRPAGPTMRLCDMKNGFYATDDSDNPYSTRQCAKCT